MKHTDDTSQRLLYTTAGAVYAHLLPLLKSVARGRGYALAVHGSMATDFDVIACPWTAEAVDAYELVEAIRAAVGGVLARRDYYENPSLRAHGRLAWSIYFDEESAVGCTGPYLDISVMPRLVSPETLS